MEFKVEDSIFEKNSNICVGYVIAADVDNRKANDKIAQMFEGIVSETSKEFEAGVKIADMDFLEPYHVAMNNFEIKSRKYLCSVESILTRIFKKGGFPSISPVVDLGNYISIRHKVPVGIHDLDKIDSGLVLRCAEAADCDTIENSVEGDLLLISEPVYATGNSVRTRRWTWRQMNAGKITENSSNFIFLIDGFTENRSAIETACNEISRLLEEILKCETSIGIVDRDNPVHKFGKLTVEEQEIEEGIAIILKGVASHTAVNDIRKKLLEAKQEKRPLRVKLGLDPSAPDIHLGHSVVLRKIRQLQNLGHMAVIIIGDYTGRIGDPSGKSKTRKPLTEEEVKQNAETYMEQIFKIIDKERTEVYYNSEWLSKMNFADVIELASKCTVARMLERDDFNNRFTNHLPLSIHEFFYPLMQAYDSVAIKADIELGGTDQTFNILMGRNIQRDYGVEPQLTLFMPLLEGIDGIEKMSKSLGNYIGISEEPYIIFEKTMKIPDDFIIKYYNLCTDVHPNKIQELQNELNNGVNPRDIKIKLAFEITELYCGKDAAVKAEEHFKTVFQNNQVPDNAPVIVVDESSEVSVGEQIISEVLKYSNYKSKNEIRRVFSQGGAKFNDEKKADIYDLILSADENVLKLGKSNFFRINKK